jgi:adenylate kinase family enzyme
VDSGSVLILTGPPGSGKTTVAHLVAERFERAVYLESDWFWTTIVRGFIPPWQPESADQNRAVLGAVAAAAAALASGGYTVVIDGIVGPWYLSLVADEMRRAGVETHYQVLRPRLDVALARATARKGEERVPGHPALTDEEPIRHMWQQFAELGEFERSVIDSSEMDPAETVELVWSRFQEGDDRL